MKQIIHASIAAFITYLSMYAFRKPFTAATYDNLTLWGMDYKILLIMAQLMGYTLSKYIGIKVVAELKEQNRIWTLLLLMGMAGVSLFFFAIVPAPYNLVFMFLNGLPLGLIWGVVFSFLEGRKTTEFLGAVMASSFIVSSGFVKSIGKYLLDDWAVPEMWMPLYTAILFLPLLGLGVWLLKRLKGPDEADKEMRTARTPMTLEERNAFIKRFAPGLLFSVLIYVGLTVFRDMRDNFAVEFWTSQGFGNTPELLLFSEFPIAFMVLLIISFMVLIKNNRFAFFINHGIMLACGILMLVSTVFFMMKWMGPISWMIIVGFSMYMPYIAYHTVYFERWIAYFRYKGNAGFLMYMADSAGYLGSILVLFYRNFGAHDLSWSDFFTSGSLAIGTVMVVLSLIAYIYFLKVPANGHTTSAIQKTVI